MHLRIWDVEHGACAMVSHGDGARMGSLAMIDSGCTSDWRPSTHIRKALGRDTLNYLVITNADQDHMSDLDGLWKEGVRVETLIRNPHPSPEVLRAMKEENGPLTKDIERYISIHAGYRQPVTRPFDSSMGGITMRAFYNSYPAFMTTNDLSLAVFLSFGAFKILFPGDLEEKGWHALLQDEAFRGELAGVCVLVASHHGRENGYCEHVFRYCEPQVVIMSDKAIVHDTQLMAQTYRERVVANHPDGILVATTGKRRHVLTTRRDGTIDFEINDRGDFRITTEHHG